MKNSFNEYIEYLVVSLSVCGSYNKTDFEWDKNGLLVLTLCLVLFKDGVKTNSLMF